MFITENCRDGRLEILLYRNRVFEDLREELYWVDAIPKIYKLANIDTKII